MSCARKITLLLFLTEGRYFTNKITGGNVLCIFALIVVIFKYFFIFEQIMFSYLKKNLISNEMIIGMGAGVISRWMQRLKYLI